MASSVDTEGYFVELLALLESIPRANLYSVAIGLGALVIVRLLKRYAPRVPGALVALILLTTIVAALQPGQERRERAGCDTVGATFPQLCPPCQRPITCDCSPAPWPSWPSRCAKACCWSANTAASTGTRRTATRCCSPMAWPIWRPA